jgi:itaconyl-CoA hydratase
VIRELRGRRKAERGVQAAAIEKTSTYSKTSVRRLTSMARNGRRASSRHSAGLPCRRGDPRGRGLGRAPRAGGSPRRSRVGRTITDSDNVWLTCLTLNANQRQFNAVYAERALSGRSHVDSCLTLALVTGLSVPDTSNNGTTNLSQTDIRRPNPVFLGDALWAESEVLAARRSRSDPSVGIVELRTRGVNQRGEVVIEYLRSFMVYSRDAAQAAPAFPEVDAVWTVGAR